MEAFLWDSDFDFFCSIKNDIAPGDWIIYVNSEEFDVLGPFKNMDDAFNFAKSNLGVACFVDGNLEI